MTNIAHSGEPADAPGTLTLETKLPVSGSLRTGRWTLALLGVVVFASGVICGATATRMRSGEKALADWNGLLERVANRMQRELHLTEQQRECIEDIVKAHQPELDRIRSRTLKQTRSELQQVIEEMSAALTPEQAARFRSEAQSHLDAFIPPDGSESSNQSR